MEASSKQLEFDWPRSRQTAALRECRLPDVQAKDGVTVKAGVSKSVLQTIDQFGRECFASIDTIAARANYSRRHVKRAIEALESLSLITKERRKNSFGTTTNHYRIVWSELELRCQTKVPFRHCAANDQSAFQTEHSALETDQSALEALKPPRSAKKNTTPPPSASSLHAWAEVEKAFSDQGVGQAARLLAIAQQRQLSPDECLALAEYFAAHAIGNGWGPGVLYSRVANAVAGGPIDDPARWIPPSAAAKSRQAIVRRERERVKAAIDQAKAREVASDLQSLETRYGAAIDALPREAQRQLVALAHSHSRLALHAFGKSGLSGWVRTDCLQIIAADPDWLRVLTDEAIR